MDSSTPARANGSSQRFFWLDGSLEVPRMTGREMKYLIMLMLYMMDCGDCEEWRSRMRQHLPWRDAQLKDSWWVE